MYTKFTRISIGIPNLKVGNPDHNTKEITKIIDSDKKSSDVIVFPELCITGYSCGELFYQDALLTNTLKSISLIKQMYKNTNSIVILGFPLKINSLLYNCAGVIYKGKILGIVPKTYLPNKQEFYDKRWFSRGSLYKESHVDILGEQIPFGNLVFKAANSDFSFGVEICEDLWAPIPPSSFLYLKGAKTIFNLSASNALIAKSDYRKSLVSGQSARFNGAYAYASCGVYESTTDYLMDGHGIIAENGIILKESKRFSRKNQLITQDIDLDALDSLRLRNSSFADSFDNFDLSTVREINFPYETNKKDKLIRTIDPTPFVPKNKAKINEHCEEIFNIQVAALAKRFEHTNLKTAVIGISGGLDSTLALLVVVKAFDLLDIPRKNILGVTMPGFGTTDLTHSNSIRLMDALGISSREINIVDNCLLHFEKIEHDKDIHDVTYENVQARERTEILMNLANKLGGLVIGTGDLSELALGWCTYNGDHMSMYAVNNSIPKTLVKYLVAWESNKEESKIKEVLDSILATPITPELLPNNAGKISQKTEDILGPYLVHDFYLYYFVKFGFHPVKILNFAEIAFADKFSRSSLKKWLKVFLRRFFTQQFKRSCIPDGPKVGSISLSPRADWKMPSDADFENWIKELEKA